jgi:hypothetical protein
MQYLVISSMAYERYGDEHNQTRSYQTLFAICPLVAEFAPVPGRRPGPTIRILRVPAPGSLPARRRVSGRRQIRDLADPRTGGRLKESPAPSSV